VFGYVSNESRRCPHSFGRIKDGNDSAFLKSEE
jgi:hypothetical protein